MAKIKMKTIIKTIISVSLALLATCVIQFVAFLGYNLAYSIWRNNEFIWLPFLFFVPIIFFLYSGLHFGLIRKIANFSYTAVFYVSGGLLATYFGHLLWNKTWLFNEVVYRPIVYEIFGPIGKGMFSYEAGFSFYFSLPVVLCTAIIFAIDLILIVTKAYKVTAPVVTTSEPESKDISE